MKTPGQPTAEGFRPFYIQPGTRVGVYVVRDAIGRGGAQMAYLADAPDGQQVVLKMSLYPKGREGSTDRKAHDRFQRQIDLFRALRGSEGVAEIFGHGMFPGESESGYAFLVQELVPGNLNILDWARKEPHALEAIIDAWLTLATACANMAQQKICHRDLKPENILMAPGGVPKIVDFNSAKSANAEALTTRGSGRWPGTRLYYSPDVCRLLLKDPALLDVMRFEHLPTTDIHALGVILYQVLTGEYPFDEDASDSELFEQIVHRIPKRPRRLNPEVPFGLDKLTMRMLAKDPRKRHQDGGELAADLWGLPYTNEDWTRPFQTPATERRPAPSRSPKSPTTAPSPSTPPATDGSAALVATPSAIVLAEPRALARVPEPEPLPPVPRRRSRPVRAERIVAVVVLLLLLGRSGALGLSIKEGMMSLEKTMTAFVAAGFTACAGLTGKVITGEKEWLESCPPASRKAVNELLLSPDEGIAWVLPGPHVIIQPYHRGLEVQDGPVEAAASLPGKFKGVEGRLYGVIRTGTDGATIHFEKMKLYQGNDTAESGPSGPTRDICAVGLCDRRPQRARGDSKGREHPPTGLQASPRLPVRDERNAAHCVRPLISFRGRSSPGPLSHGPERAPPVQFAPESEGVCRACRMIASVPVMFCLMALLGWSGCTERSKEEAQPRTASTPPAPERPSGDDGSADDDDDGFVYTIVPYYPPMELSVATGELDRPNRYLSAVMVYAEGIGKPEAVKLCSGVLVSPRLVLTAASCVCSPQPAAQGGGGQTLLDAKGCASIGNVQKTTYFPRDSHGPPGVEYGKYDAAVRVHPAFKQVLDERGNVVSSEADLAVFVLDQAADIPPVELAESDVNAGESLAIVGHGDPVNANFGREFSASIE